MENKITQQIEYFFTNKKNTSHFLSSIPNTLFKSGSRKLAKLSRNQSVYGTFESVTENMNLNHEYTNDDDTRNTNMSPSVCDFP